LLLLRWLVGATKVDGAHEVDGCLFLRWLAIKTKNMVGGWEMRKKKKKVTNLNLTYPYQLLYFNVYAR
jgi:hypothetical protein